MESPTGTAKITHHEADEEDDWSADEWWFPFTREDNFS